MIKTKRYYSAKNLIGLKPSVGIVVEESTISQPEVYNGATFQQVFCLK